MKKLIDTNPEIEKKFIDLIKKGPVSERLSRVLELTSLTLNLSKRALERRYLKKSQQELALLFIKYN